MRILLVQLLLFACPLLAANDLELIAAFSSDVIAVDGNVGVSVKIRNNGDETVTLVLPGDGSMSGRRTPLIGFSAIPIAESKEHPKEVPLYTGLGCGNINSLKNSEIFTLNHNDEKELGNWIGLLHNLKPDKYRIVFYYQNIPQHRMGGILLGKNEDGVEDKIKSSTPVFLVSNEVVIEVVPSPENN